MMRTLHDTWNQLALRERRLVVAATVLLAAAALWLGLLGPALRTLKTAPQQHRALNAQLQTMHDLQTQAQALQQQAPLTRAEAQRALNQATQQVLGKAAQVSTQGERITITLQGATPETLALWLAQARANARAVPIEARLTRQNQAQGTRWSGTLVMALPDR
mgnify:CR=1 FL=1